MRYVAFDSWTCRVCALFWNSIQRADQHKACNTRISGLPNTKRMSCQQKHDRYSSILSASHIHWTEVGMDGTVHVEHSFRVLLCGMSAWKNTWSLTEALASKQSLWRVNFERCEVSLPRVLFGHNGKLLSSQSDIGRALHKVYALLDLFTGPALSQREFTRVDLVWQFKGNPSDFALAHCDCLHPMIRRPAIDYRNNGLRWEGSHLNILMYDKLLQQKKMAGDVVRG